VIDQTWYLKPPGVRERTSAGGVVVRFKDGKVQVALAREGDFTDYILPKGGVEIGEDLDTTARREVLEEAGIRDLVPLGAEWVRERLDFSKRKWITTHYFLYFTYQENGEPTDPNHPYRCGWFSIDALPEMFWPEQRLLLEENRDLIIRLVNRDRSASPTLHRPPE